MASASHLDAPPSPTVPVDDPIPGHVERGPIQLELQTVAEGAGLTAPSWGTFAPGHPDVLFVVDQDGPLWAVDLDTGRKSLFPNTRDLLVPLGAFGPGTFDEGLLYTYTSEPPGDPFGQPNHTSHVREWRVPDPTADPVATATSDDQGPGASGAVPTRVLLQVTQPQFNHHAGALSFGTRPDDRHLLSVTLGDGGCAHDQNRQQGLQGGGPWIGHEPGSEEEVDARIVEGGNCGWHLTEGRWSCNPSGHELLGFVSDGSRSRSRPAPRPT